MIYLKSYCYSKHELPFIKAQLDESKGHVDKFYLYEFDCTHTGAPKKFELEGYLPQDDRLVYKPVSIINRCVYSPDTEGPTHSINEPIQRSYIFNDPEVNLCDEDIIFDVDVDEIIYSSSYKKLIHECPTSIRLNQFFFKKNYLWTDCNFASPSVYRYSVIKNTFKNVSGLRVSNQTRDLSKKTCDIHGCHMSWIMPIDCMINKLNSYSHIKYKKFADPVVLQRAVDNKQYIFDPTRSFNIEELSMEDPRIPRSLA